MFAIAVNALYTTLRRRGTTRQLAGAIVICAVSALLLLPAIIWYNMRFIPEQATLSMAEVEVALVYVALWGWLVPLGVTTTYCLFTLPRTSTNSMEIPRQKRTTRANTKTPFQPPRHQPGILSPLVFSEDTPWGWLTYRGGRFQGQRLALKRVVVTIGRGEHNDIWLDDDMVSRDHAELAWDADTIYITDCYSLNGVLQNGQRIHGTALVEPADLLEIGSQRFLFEKATPPDTSTEQDDPLVRHVWHSAASLTSSNSNVVAATKPLEDDPSHKSVELAQASPDETSSDQSQVTAELEPVASSPQLPELDGAFIIQDGPRIGQSFVLDRPVITIGRGAESDVVINDVSISRRHAQVLRQANGNYVQDLASRNGTKVNEEPLQAPQLLQIGDIVCLGSVRLEYVSVETARTTPTSMIIPPQPSVRPISGLVPLRLPTKPKNP